MTLRQPTVFHDINPAPKDAKPVSPEVLPQPDRVMVEQFLFAEALSPWLAEQAGQRAAEIEKVGAPRRDQPERPDRPGSDPICRIREPPSRRKDRPGTRRDDLPRPSSTWTNSTIVSTHAARNSTRSGTARSADITHIGRAMVLPHPERQTPQIAPMVRDEEVEKLAVKSRHRARGGPGVHRRERRSRQPGV